MLCHGPWSNEDAIRSGSDSPVRVGVYAGLQPRLPIMMIPQFVLRVI